MLTQRCLDANGRTDILKTVLVLSLWTIGIIAAIRLIYNAFYLLYLAVIFGLNAPPTPILSYVVFVAKNAIPAAIFTGIGLLGLLAWPSRRLWPLGLSAIIVETILAIYDKVNPANEIILNLVPG